MKIMSQEAHIDIVNNFFFFQIKDKLVRRTN